MGSAHWLSMHWGRERHPCPLTTASNQALSPCPPPVPPSPTAHLGWGPMCPQSWACPLPTLHGRSPWALLPVPSATLVLTARQLRGQAIQRIGSGEKGPQLPPGDPKVTVLNYRVTSSAVMFNTSVARFGRFFVWHGGWYNGVSFFKNISMKACCINMREDKGAWDHSGKVMR